MRPLRMLRLLMLMFPLCDAASRCPEDLLTFDPPEVLGRIGESVIVNCTSPDEYHDGITWRVGNSYSPAEMDLSFASWEVELTEWNVTAECTIQMNATQNCSKELKITIYNIPDQPIVFPTQHAAALEGTPYQLQCNIDDVAPVQKLTVTWYRDNKPIHTDAFTNTTKTPVSESSTLEVSISREDDGARFSCEAQLDLGPLSPPPLMSDVHTVSVHYAPEFKNETEDVYVNEDDVILSCGAEGRPPPDYTWTCDGLNVSGDMKNLTITDLRASTTCFCTANNYLGNRTKQINVHVTTSVTTALYAAPAAATTPEPTAPRACPIVLSPAEVVVEFGGPASASCSTEQAVLGMGWEATAGGTGFEAGPYVRWEVDEVKAWDINATCYVTRKDNSQCNSSIAVTVYKTPDSVSVSGPGLMAEGEEYELDCDISNVAPVQKLTVNWYRDNNKVTSAKFHSTRKSPESLISTLKIRPERDHNGALYRCETELQLGPNGPEEIISTPSSPYTAAVIYKPEITACPDRFSGVEHEFRLDMVPCVADGNPPPRLQWSYGGELINASEPLIRSKAGTYTAVIENSLGRISTSVEITIEYGPSFTCDDHYEIEEKSELPCEPQGEPTPDISWYKDGEEVVPPQLWTKEHSGNYSVQATNKHGTASHTLTLNILYAPVLHEWKSSLELVPGQNVTLNCSADGNPPPELHWNFNSEVNVRSDTRGSQKIIRISGATSTNAGVYNCTATNRVGTVTSSVTLTMKGKSSRVPMNVIWWLLIILIVALILFLIFFAHKRSKKHGQYSFIPDRAKESSNIPMTPQSNGV